MAMDFDPNHLSDTGKAACMGIPFLAGTIKGTEPPMLTKIIQGVMIALLGAGALALGNIALSPIGLSDDIREIKQTLKHDAEVRALELKAVKNMALANSNAILNLSADVKVVRNQVQIGTAKRVYRDEWNEINREYNKRLLHLERHTK